MARWIRILAWTIAVGLVAATLLRLGDQLNVIDTPPAIPDTANLVQRLLALIPYRQAIWPVYLAWNGLFAIGLLLLIPLSTLLVRAVAGADARMRAAGALLAAGGIIGAVGQLGLIGAISVAVGQPYCDCGFKETEVVAQSWAQNLIVGSSDWLVAGALVLAGLGVAWFGSVLAGRARLASLGRFGWLAGAALIASAILTIVDLLDPLPDLVAFATFGIIVPIWAFWLGREAAVLGEPSAPPA
jgi:hypothetical protein